MSRSPPTSPVHRLGGAGPRAAESSDRGEGHVPLRLTVARGALGLELYEPLALGPLAVTQLSLTLPNLRYPLDLSGGVPVFRHRRGELEQLELQARVEQLAQWMQPAVQEALGSLVRPVSVWALPGTIGIGMVTENSALAFDLLWAPVGSDARLVVTNARGVGLGGPALGYALRTVDSALGRVGQRCGRVLKFPALGRVIARQVLPAVGARVPAARRVRLGELRADAGLLSVELDTALLPPVLGCEAGRAIELARLVREPDQALASGELEAARAGYLVALEQAPRHPELTRLVAEIDYFVPDRAEAALGMIVESMQAVQAGWIGAALLARVGDLDAARMATSEAARAERYAPLAGLLWAHLAMLGGPPGQQLAALDRAVACAPSLAQLRWLRFAALAKHGDVQRALVDAQHIEAAAAGARERHAACRRAAQALLQAGFVCDAGKLFERALRYLPDDAAATAGLARSLLEAGRSERAFCLLARAVELSEREGRADADALVDLASLLAQQLQDLPQAIARVRQVPVSSRRAVEARFLEASWRAKLGDLVGASLAFGRLREAVELQTEPASEWAQWLADAAEFEGRVREDPVAAERHLALALRLQPRKSAIAEAYREVAAAVNNRARGDGQ